MKKTLLVAMASLALGITSSQAQAVYSQNIVGYVNVTLTASAYNMITVPLNAGTNAADALISSLQPGDILYVWDATNNAYYSSTFYGPGTGPNGEAWYDVNNNFTNAPQLTVGQGFFVSTQGGVQETNTFTGSVLTTNSAFLLGSAYNMVGSAIPIGGSLDSTNLLGNTLQPGDIAYIWDPIGNGYYSSTYYGPGTGPNGEAWYDVNNNFTNAPVVTVGQGYFISTQSGNNEVWNQNLIIN